MWTCHKCGKPVYFAERKQSLGYDWHPECLRCEECGKRLNPGQHAEHKGVPYCHVPCYGALFGPTLFGHGSAVEAHKSFGRVENRPGIVGERSHLEAKLKLYNQYYEGKSQELKFRERNGKLILEGVLQIFWGVNNPIHLKEDDDQRTHVQVRKRNSYRLAINNGMEDDTIRPFVPGSAADAHDDSSSDEDKPSTDKNCKGSSEHKTDEVDRASNQQTGSCLEASKQQLPNSQDELKGSTGLPNEKQSSPGKDASQEIVKTDKNHLQVPDNKEVPEVRIRKMASSRSRTKLKRRCSINGHYYNRETRVFTPPFGSATNVWITSMVNSPEVINMLLDKFRIEDNPQDFALYVVRDNGETRKILEHEYPLLVRVMLGPHEDVAKVFIMDTRNTSEISNEVAQFLNLADPELRAILQRFHEEEEREAKKIKLKFREMKRLMKYRLEVLKKQKQ